MTESCGVVAERRRPKRRRRAVVRGRIPGRGHSARALPPRRAPALRAAAVPHTCTAPTTGTAPPILTPPGTTTGGSFSRYCCENCFQITFSKYSVYSRNRSPFRLIRLERASVLLIEKIHIMDMFVFWEIPLFLHI